MQKYGKYDAGKVRLVTILKSFDKAQKKRHDSNSAIMSLIFVY